MLGGFPQEFPKFLKIAEQNNISLKIYTKNITEFGTPDLLILCTSRTSHSYQSVFNKYKYKTTVKYLNICSKKKFKQLIQDYLNDIHNKNEISNNETISLQNIVESNDNMINTNIEPINVPTSLEKINKKVVNTPNISEMILHCKENIETSILLLYQQLETVGINNSGLSITYNDDIGVKISLTINQ